MTQKVWLLVPLGTVLVIALIVLMWTTLRRPHDREVRTDVRIRRRGHPTTTLYLVEDGEDPR